jgi:hypothetical protein
MWLRLSHEFVSKEKTMIVAEARTTVISETADLGIGLLIAESEDGVYQPIGPVGSMREARQIAANDMRRRMHRLDQGSDPLCPARYVVWAQGSRGEYAAVAEIEPS